MANDFSALIPENGTWADYCDALQNERWLRRLEAKRMSRSCQQMAPTVPSGHPDAGRSDRDDGDERSR